MAIYWVDPYIESTNGGIHGTTGSGSGTYSSPWTLTNLKTNNFTNVFTSGDEVRLKGLPESTFFPTQSTFTSVTISSGDPTRYYFDSQYSYRLCRIKDLRGNIFYEKFYSTSIRTVASGSSWYTGLPPLDQTYGFYPFNTNYSITPTSFNASMFAGLNASITLTSGWTSETEKLGITIIDTNTGTNNQHYIGPSTDSVSKYLDINCPELIISLTYSSYLYIYANTLRLKALAGGYAPGYSFSMFIGASASNNFTSTQGSVSISTTSYGGYLTIYSFGGNNTKPVIELPYTAIGYQGTTIYLMKNNSSSFDLKFKTIYGQYSWYVYNYNGTSTPPTVNLYFNTDWSAECKSGSFTIDAAGIPVVNEYFSSTQYTTKEFSSTSTAFFGTFAYLPQPNSNYSPLNIQDTTYYVSATSKLKRVTVPSGIYRSFIKRLIIENGETLDTLSIGPGFTNAANSYGTPQKVTVSAEPVSGKPVQLLGPTSAGELAIIYEKSGKLTWKLFGAGNGKVYADTFGLPKVDYGSSSLTLSATFTTTSTPGISIAIKLYGINKTTGIPTLLNTITPTVNGNTITATYTVSNSTLNTYNVSTLFTIVDITKNSSDTCDVTFESMSLSTP